MRSRRAERVVAERERRGPQGVCWGKCVGEDWGLGAGEAPVPQRGEGEWDCFVRVCPWRAGGWGEEGGPPRLEAQMRLSSSFG